MERIFGTHGIPQQDPKCDDGCFTRENNPYIE